MGKIFKIISVLFLGLYLSLILFYPTARSAPKLANYFLHNQISDAQARELAKWDLVILDMEVQYTSPAQLTLLKKLNPDIILLAYITSEEIRDDAAAQNWGPLRKKLAQGIDPKWYLADASGNKMSFWSGTSMLNISDLCPEAGGMKFNQYLARFVADEILNSGKWDGVFYDNGWEKLTWFTATADLNRDGQNESNLDIRWQAGMKELFNSTRALTGNRYLVVTNGTSKVYRDNVNGIMSESFPAMDGWHGTMGIYYFQDNGGPTPRILVINANTANTGDQQNYRAMRYGLASTLMGSGYYSFDHGNQDHGQMWWYDEYNVKLGEPMGPARSLNGKTFFSDDVWLRDYTNGTVLVNALSTPQSVDLGGDFEKISGTQDKSVNNGLIVDRVRIGARDGLILLKTIKTLDNLVFANGSFARFFTANGNRARNGFFIFDDSAIGGGKILRSDTNNDGKLEKVVVAGPRLTLINSDGGYWYNDYPFNPNLNANLNLAVGRLSGSSDTIIVAPPKGGQATMYNYFGQKIKERIAPFGAKYSGSLALAIGDTDGDAVGEVIFGAGAGIPAEILVYDSAVKKIKTRFFPFDKKYKDGLVIASGDVNGDGKAEIIALQTKIKKPVVRIFDSKGKKLSEFNLSSAFGAASYSLASADVNYDGKDEVVVMSE